MREGLVIFLGLLVPVALAAGQVSCANGGLDSGAPSDGGDDSTVDGGPGEGGKKDSGSFTDASVTKACADNAISYCNQLSMCSPYLLSLEYGDVPTCQTQLGGAFCSDIVTAKGSGWTGAGLEACAAARQKLSCQDFLYLKPAPPACRPTGTLPMVACRYDSQCGSGFCRIPAGSVCGNCVSRGTTLSPCTALSDCDGNLVCSGMGTCAAPAPLGGACDPMTMPCLNGLECIGGKCAVGGGPSATCDEDAGVGCDPNLGVYCSAGTCSPITVAMAAATCGGSPPSVCYGDGTCSGGFCVPPISDGQPCDGGVNCTSPSTCNTGTCGLFPASQCH